MRFCWVILFFIALAMLIYSKALHIPFMLDDTMFLNDNHKNITGLWSSFLATPNEVYYRPVIHVVFKLMYYFFRDDTFGYHAVNLILYILSAVCIYVFVKRIASSFVAVCAGLFFIAHPINVSLITYSTTTCFSLQIIFMMLSLIFISNDQSRIHARIRLIFSLFCFVLGVMCHETGLTLPFYVLGYFYFIRRDVFLIAFKKSMWHFIVFVAFLVFRMKFARFDHGVTNHFVLFDMNVGEYIASFTRLVVWYVSQLFLPDGIVPIWSVGVIRQSVVWWVIGFMVAVLALCAVVCVSYLRRPSPPPSLPPQGGGMLYGSRVKLLAFGLWWLALGFLPLIPACLVEPTRGMIVEPYWFGFASIGFFIFVAQCIDYCFLKNEKEYPPLFLKRGQGELKHKFIIIPKLIVAFLIFSWSMLSYIYVDLWSNSLQYLNFWQQKAPHYSKVNCHLAREYHRLGQTGIAKEYYVRCVVPQGSSLMEYHSNLGIIDLNDGRFDSAEAHLKTALRFDPRSLSLYTQLGVIAFKRNDIVRAKELFAFAMQDKFAVLPRLNMAGVLKKEGRLSDAEALYKDVLTIDPREKRAFLGLLRIYILQNDQEKAKAMAKNLR